MSLPYTNPSLISATNPYFQDNDLVRGDQARNNNVKIWGNFDYLNWNILAAKTSLVDADLFGIADSAASFAYKPITWANIIIALKAIAYRFAPTSSPIQTIYQASGAADNTTSTYSNADTIPQNTGGKQLYTQAITPLFATSTIRVEYCIYIGGGSGTQALISALFVDSDANAVAAARSYASGADRFMNPHVQAYEVSAASTSARTYKLRYGTNTGTAYINSDDSGRQLGGVLLSWMRVTELRA